MEMPKSWKIRKESCAGHKVYSVDRFYFEHALDLMKEMAEALEELSVIYYPASSNITKEDLNTAFFGPARVIVDDFEKLKIIQDHNERAFKALEALKKFKEWK